MSDLLHKVKTYVLKRLGDELPSDRHYHSIEHTEMVVKATEEIGRHYDLDQEEMENLLVAAWFHDLGHVEQYYDHELASVRIMENFLKDLGVHPDRIDTIARIIISTHIDRPSVGLYEEIIHDADIFNIGNDTFFSTGDSLRKEWEEAEGRKYSDAAWNRLQYEFLIQNDFFTEYARKKYGPTREENLRQAQAKLED